MMFQKVQLYDHIYDPPRVCTWELVNWAKECHENISIYAFNARYKKFYMHIADQG